MKLITRFYSSNMYLWFLHWNLVDFLRKLGNLMIASVSIVSTVIISLVKTALNRELYTSLWKKHWILTRRRYIYLSSALAVSIVDELPVEIHQLEYLLLFAQLGYRSNFGNKSNFVLIKDRLNSIGFLISGRSSLRFFNINSGLCNNWVWFPKNRCKMLLRSYWG